MSNIKSAKKRQSIMSAAKSLFLQDGYSAVSMSKISELAEVSKNTLYSHFKNKEDLFQAVLFDHWQSSSSPRLRVDDDRDIQVALTEFARALMQYLYKEDTLQLFRLIIAEAKRFPELTRSIVSNDQAPIHANIDQYLQNRIEGSHLSSKQAAGYFLGLLKEDAFWHVLCGFRLPYTSEEIEVHVQQAVKAFLVCVL